MYYVYVLANQNEDTYIGKTPDLRRRVDEHKKGRSQYTKDKNMELIYYEAFLSKKDADEREWKLKQDGRARYGLMKRLNNSKETILVGLK